MRESFHKELNRLSAQLGLIARSQPTRCRASKRQRPLDALHVLLAKGQQAKEETPGKLSADQQDLLRAALVFTSSGLDACLTRLLRDTCRYSSRRTALPNNSRSASAYGWTRTAK
ncbi:hypothetical protein AB0F91_41410 [Amycolatopsis sp. NPDC023774]|uniref:hypothetical protein n=1 Tax=Amycolatopsis sp. NPDC023774 TaxID=3155015 RepID=UPI0033C06F07